MKTRFSQFLSLALWAICNQVLAAELPPLEQFGAIVARPLFTPGRHPSPGEEAAPTVTNPAQDVAGATVLIGIAIDRAGRAVVVLRPSGGDEIIAHVGDSVGGWSIAGISRGRLSLAASGQRITLAIGNPVPPIPIDPPR